MLKFFEDIEVGAAIPLIVAFFILVAAALIFIPISFGPVIEKMIVLAPVWLPLVLGTLFFGEWLKYKRYEYTLKQGSVLLEIRLNRDITRNPKAIEVMLASIHQSGSPTWHENYLQGKHRPWYSFELASFEGEIHFYIWTQPRWRDTIEAWIYAGYPNVEIVEVEDYTKDFVYDMSKYKIWGTNWKLKQPDQFPIKTYIDYGLDKDPKEEFKIDPFVSVLEYLGYLRKGEQCWIQILFRQHRKETLIDGRLFPTPDWKDAIDAEIEKIRKDATPDFGGQFRGFPNPTPVQKEVMEALARSREKLAFDVMIRGLYIAKAENFNITNVTGLVGAWRQFSSMTLNRFGITNWTDFDYAWLVDPWRVRRTAREYKFIDAFKRRSFFQYPYKFWLAEPYILTSEELATIYHFPGEVAATPTLPRIPSKRAEAPPNLPV